MIGHRQLTGQDYWDIFRRRRWLVMIPLIAGPLIGLGLTLVLPSRWTSLSEILIEHQQVPKDIVQPVISEDLNARLATMQAQVLSRSRLEPVIKKYNLFNASSGHETMDQMVDDLTTAITLTAVKPAVSSQDTRNALPAFTIGVELSDPRTAQQICAEITSMFIDENLREREQAAQSTTNFLQGQLDDAKQALNQQDAALAAFKEKYFGSLPDQTQANLSMISTLNTQLRAASSQLDRTQQDKTYNESLIAQLKAQMPAPTSGETSEPDTLAQMQKTLAGFRDKLAVMETQYTPDYPDVVALKQAIANLKKQIDAKQEAPVKSGPTATPAAITPAAAAIVTQLGRVESQVRANDEAVRQITAAEKSLQNQINQYESRLQLSPQVEEQYKEITRNHDTALKVYNTLLEKRDESQMATALEQAQQGEQFILIDPANLPAKPSFPDPLKFGGGGLGGGLALGVMLALLAELVDKTLRNEKDVQAILGVYPMARIPLFENDGKAPQSRIVMFVPEAEKR